MPYSKGSLPGQRNSSRAWGGALSARSEDYRCGADKLPLAAPKVPPIIARHWWRDDAPEDAEREELASRTAA